VAARLWQSASTHGAVNLSAGITGVIGGELYIYSAGRYEAQGEGILTVSRENDFLTIESPADWDLPKLRIRPESPRDFFANELPVSGTPTLRYRSNKECGPGSPNQNPAH
jgi:hypothetical protein